MNGEIHKIYEGTFKITNDEIEITKESGHKPKYFDNLIKKLLENKSYSFGKTTNFVIQNDVINYLKEGDKIYLVISDRQIDINPEKEVKQEKGEDKIEKKEKRKTSKTMDLKIWLSPIFTFFKIITEISKIIYKKLKIFYLEFFNSKMSKKDAEKLLVSKNFDISVVEKLLKDKNFLTRNEIFDNLKFFLKSRNKSTDLLEDIKKYNEMFDKPYIISLIGTNGAGKSSSISKLLNILSVDNNINVTIIAGDTYRSGAIEQLQGYVGQYISNKQMKGHVRMYNRGYVKDEVSMIDFALKTFEKEYQHVQKTGCSNIKDSEFCLNSFTKSSLNNLVIIDTSGRQPTNENLMNSLLKLHRVCRINRSYVVSEIITGQKNNVLKFIKILSQLNVKLEVIYTKLDCTKTEIGMIFNILYESNIPIGYVCFGEKNEDIKIFDERFILNSLDLY